MSNTRRAASGKPFRQERFSSSIEFERGLLANLVARRCEVLDSAEDRELIWYVQYLSHQEGGLKPLISWLSEKCSGRIGTASMRKFGCRKGQIYDAEQVRAVRAEIDDSMRACFPLRGEYTSAEDDWDFLLGTPDAKKLNAERAAEALANPNNYPAEKFHKICLAHLSAASAENCLKELCLNPAVSMDGVWPWWFSEFTNCLRELMAAWIAERAAATVTTEVGAKVHEAIDYAIATKCLVLVDGMARIGKTFSARAWCEQHPGMARYVQVPCTNDEIGFYRAIAKSLGVSINLNSKAQELRTRVEETLQDGNLAIIFDEAHYLWPNLIDPRTLPARVNWLLTALVNYKVPVVLIATPQFLKAQSVMEAKTRWTSEQFNGRLGHYEPLPETLCESDLEKVAQAVLPEGDATSIKILVRYAQASSKYLAGIEIAVRRARYLAGKDGRKEVSRADIKQAIEGSVIPSDSAFAKAMELPQRKSGRRSAKLILNEPSASFKEDLSDRSQTNLPDEKSGEASGRNRLELHRQDGELVPG